MANSWQVVVYENKGQVFSGEIATELLEFGRQRPDEQGPYSLHEESGRSRLVIARLNEAAISRKHALLKRLGADRIVLTNQSTGLAIPLSAGRELAPGSSCELPLPFSLSLGNKSIRVQIGESSEEMPLQCLAEVTAPPGIPLGLPGDLQTMALSMASSVEIERLLRWLQSAMEVLHSAAGSSDFFTKAARAVVDMVGLDSGQVLLAEHEGWSTVAAQAAGSRHAESIRPPSQKILSKVRKEKRTFWQALGSTGMGGESLAGVKAVVAAPILDRHGNVLGVLYGDRWVQGLAAVSRPFTKLEASLVELLASGVAAGLARVKQEQKVVEARVQFEQFFTKELANELATHENILTGKDVQVSILFADIRNYSRISERLGPSETLSWLRTVLNSLSECVLAERGVLVDYIGDELMAMWGAPEEQPDHAARACRAALAMLDRLPKLNERWQAALKETLGLGIGINTGIARVGNVGSKHKFKYGPLGNTVNMASRVEGATKYLKTRLLVTEATQKLLDDTFPSRRVCKVSVVNIAEPVYLYELAAGYPNWPDLKARYEQALQDFENREFRRSARALGALLATPEYRDDGPAIVLLSRAVNFMVEEPENFDPVWQLPGK
ncbi:MAG: adenylate/guanylate cyclase domain-containing protein [Gemmataceae bacterium]